MPPSRQRSGRRESASSATSSAKHRKPGISNQGLIGNGANQQRPRANTISHVDNATLGMLAAANCSSGRSGFEPRDNLEINALPGVAGYNFKGMSTAAGHHGFPPGLPKLETNVMHTDFGSSLRTAPPYGNFDNGMHNIWCGPDTTVNPAQLHFANSPHHLATDTPSPPYLHYQTPHGQNDAAGDANFGWLSGFENQMSFANVDENAIDASSPSAESPGSPSALDDLILDGASIYQQSKNDWQSSVSVPVSLSATFPMETIHNTFPQSVIQDGVSPNSHQVFNGGTEQYLPSPSQFSHTSPCGVLAHDGGIIPFPESETYSNSTGSITGSNRHSSITSLGTDGITDATRQAMLSNLSHAHSYAHTQQSKQEFSKAMSFPSTMDLQRFVGAYIQYFHPHLPFLHLPSLSFDVSCIAYNFGTYDGGANSQPSAADGNGALILAMAAIGAFYEYETEVSKELFEMARKMIKAYLEQRHQAETSSLYNSIPNPQPSVKSNPPLWLVQAMLLNVIYGHNCGEKRKIDTANVHCAALAGLVQAVEFARPLATNFPPRGSNFVPIKEDVEMTSADMWQQSAQHHAVDGYSQWQTWVYAEERKRTLYAVFVLSSMLVSAYNQPPTLMNSEIHLDLPCDEDLWAAESFEAWSFLGGAFAAESKSVTFAAALTELLTASQRLGRRPQHPSHNLNQSVGSCLQPDELPDASIQPGAYGCLVLINALHNYIWETRQRHMGRQWTPQETDSMHNHLEPALRAFQAAWASNPQHSVDRSSKTETGTLSADCIPLLDLAYIRLLVNVGPSKEAVWRRDWKAMADELAHGPELVQHASFHLNLPARRKSSPSSTMPVVNACPPATKRERQLRKAAYHAANSLVMSDKLGVTFADFTSRELPMSSSLCAFDCAQILAEWVAAVQDRVGKFMGILGKDDIDLSQAPGIVLLEDEDCNLLDRINTIIINAEVKLSSNGAIDSTPSPPSAAMALMNEEPQQKVETPSLLECGYGSKILLITASMLEKAAVWPIMLEMGQCLHAQAVMMKERAEDSILSA